MISLRLILIIVALTLCSCGEVSQLPTAVQPSEIAQLVAQKTQAIKERDAAIKTSEEAKAAAKMAREEAEAARQIAKDKDAEAATLDGVAKKLHEAEVGAEISRYAWWLVLSGGAAFAVGLGLGIYLKSKALLTVAMIGAATAGAGVVGVYLAPSWLPILKWLGAFAVASAVGVLVWLIRKWYLTAHAGADHGDRLVDEIRATINAATSTGVVDVRDRIKTMTEETIRRVKDSSAAKQAIAGVTGFVAKARKKLPA